jgi:excisionase family DNA binding protein
MKRYYTVKEAAEILQLHPDRVRAAIARHELGAFRMGSGPRARYRITDAHIEKYLQPAGAEVLNTEK